MIVLLAPELTAHCKNFLLPDYVKSANTTWLDANLIAILLAINPARLGGVVVKSQYGPVRDAWLDYFKRITSLSGSPILKCPTTICHEHLIGGLDVERTLAYGRLILSDGLLQRALGGYLMVSMAERLDPQASALISQALDHHRANSTSDSFGLIALDESDVGEDPVSMRIMDRLAFELHLDHFSMGDTHEFLLVKAKDIVNAAKLLPNIGCSDSLIEVLLEAGLKLGVISLRANQFALETAKTLAAFRGLPEVGNDELIDAARLVFTLAKCSQNSLAQQQPEENTNENQVDQDRSPKEESQESQANDNSVTSKNEEQPSHDELEDMIVEAVKASIPADLLRHSKNLSKEQMRIGKSTAHISGKSGAIQQNSFSGRPLPSRQGQPRNGKRLDILKSIRAAIPWQRLRNNNAIEASINSMPNKILFRASDLHIKQYLRRKGTVTIFLVDASGSSASQRLSEAKGALEELLAQCYVRRDEVAMISMRGSKAEIVLPPTRSLVRAKRNLATLPGGGGTPLAAGLRAANALALSLQRKGLTPVLVIFTDGRANVNLGGVGGRVSAHADALLAAQELRAHDQRILFVDTSAQPESIAQELSMTMNAYYFPLPLTSSSRQISKAVMQMVNV
jgi:magnesium chelatase subunit D